MKYLVSVPMIIWGAVTVEAEDEDAAIDQALEILPHAPNVLCPQDSGWGKNWSISSSDEWGDLEKYKIEIDVEEVK